MRSISCALIQAELALLAARTVLRYVAPMRRSIVLCAALALAGCVRPRPDPKSRIEYLVVVVQENHTFDDHFGAYCTAPAGSAPTCTSGPACCEAAPATEPSGAQPVVLDDAANAAYDPSISASSQAARCDGS